MDNIAYPIIHDLKSIPDQELLDYFSLCNVRLTKAVNGLQNLSEQKWGQEKERVQAELLRRLAETRKCGAQP